MKDSSKAGEAHTKEVFRHVFSVHVDGISLQRIVSIDVVGLAVPFLLTVCLLTGERVWISRMNKALVDGLSLEVVAAEAVVKVGCG